MKKAANKNKRKRAAAGHSQISVLRKATVKGIKRGPFILSGWAVLPADWRRSVSFLPTCQPTAEWRLSLSRILTLHTKA